MSNMKASVREIQHGLADILAHECFHVLSRANPGLRRQLYATIGFEKCAEIRFPPAMAARRITNPDAPVFDQAITVLKQKGMEMLTEDDLQFDGDFF